MLDFFRGEMTCDALLDYIDHLPSDSPFHAAVADDEEYAAMLLDTDDGGAVEPPPLTEYGPQVRALATLVDRVSYLIGVQVARAGKNPPRFDPYPRPVTAVERVRRRRAMDRHEQLVARLLPDR